MPDIEYECRLPFSCPIGRGHICCCSCDDKDNCDEVCLNDPEKCNESIKYDFTPDEEDVLDDTEGQ